METTKKTKQYTEAVGRRKTASARVRLSEAPKTTFVINDKEGKEYFPTPELQKVIRAVFEKIGGEVHFAVSVKVSGGGIHSQAEAVRHGIARALVEVDATQKDAVKEGGFLKRDARSKERRKFGLKKARKSPQWSKR